MRTRVAKLDPERPDRAVVARAAATLRSGGLVAFPTETVYGLGADALSEGAVRRVFEAKGRPLSDPIIVHVLDSDGLDTVARAVPRVASELAEAHWPGPLTLVVPKGPGVPAIVTAGLDSVAVRAPAHAVARALLSAAGVPIAAPSANRFGHASPTNADHVLDDLEGSVDWVLDAGPCPVGVESTVVDCRGTPLRLLRPGGVPLEALAPWGVTVDTAAPDPTAAAASPGQMSRHYAPRARMVVVRGSDAAADVAGVLAEAATALAAAGRHVGVLAAVEDRGRLGECPTKVEWLAVAHLIDDVAVAHGLFGALRELDGRGLDVLLARDFGDRGLALAVRDRLQRAAEGRVVTLRAGDEATAVEAVVAEAEGRR